MTAEDKQNDGWKGAAVKCDVYTHQWIAVYYSSSEKLECPNCRELRNFDEIRLPAVDLDGYSAT